MNATLSPTLLTNSSPPADASAPAASPSRLRLWTGRVLVGAPALLFVWGGWMNLGNVPEVIEASAKVGFGASTLPTLGVLQIAIALLLLVKRTAPLGAVLATAWLGGAVATHVRLGDPLFSTTLAPVYFAVVIWLGLFLVDARVQALSPFRRPVG